MIEELRQENRQLRDQMGNAGHGGGSSLKYPAPHPFDGTRGTLRGFLTQMRAYVTFYGQQFTDEPTKIFFAASLLRGDALAWFEPIQRDYLEKEDALRHAETRHVFLHYQNFEDQMKATFGDPDESRTAEQQLRNLRQKGSAADYTAKFQQIASHLQWDVGSLMAAYYSGLKDEVKDDLAKEDRPDTMAKYSAMAVRIDNRLYERRMEKRGHNPTRFNVGTPRANQGRTYQPRSHHPRQYRQSAYNDTRAPGPMELDALQRGNNQPKKKDLREITCFNCDRKGHYARDCRQPKRLRDSGNSRQVNIMEKQTATRTLAVLQRAPTLEEITQETPVEQHRRTHETLKEESRRLFPDSHIQARIREIDQEVQDLLGYKDKECTQPAPLSRSCALKECRQLLEEKDEWTEVLQRRRLDHSKTNIGDAFINIPVKGNIEPERPVIMTLTTRKQQQRWERYCDRHTRKGESSTQDPRNETWHPEQTEGLGPARELAVMSRGKRKELALGPTTARGSGSRDDDINDWNDGMEAEYDGQDLEGMGPVWSRSDILDQGAVRLPGLPARHASQEPRFQDKTSHDPEDDPWLSIKHEEHFRIHWSSCVYDECPRHNSAKLSHDFFPRRDKYPIRQAYTVENFAHRTLAEIEGAYGTFALKEGYTWECITALAWYECFDDNCQLHAQRKSREWRELWSLTTQKARLLDELIKLDPWNPEWQDRKVIIEAEKMRRRVTFDESTRKGLTPEPDYISDTTTPEDTPSEEEDEPLPPPKRRHRKKTKNYRRRS